MSALDEIRRCAARSYNDEERTDAMLREAICNACDKGDALQLTNVRLLAAIQEIADECLKHHEHNPESGVTRLPIGYATILRFTEDAKR